MKRRTSFLTVLAILLLGLAGSWFWSAQRAKANARQLKRRPTAVAQISAPNLSPTMINALYTPDQIQAGRAINALLARRTNAVIPMAQLVAAGVTKEQLTKGILDAQNAQSLDFYGKVVDQNGAPIVGAKMRGSVLINVGIENSGSTDHYTQTDAQGLFQFTGLHGVSLGVWPQKEGYEYNGRLPTGWSKDYKPDPANPVVFTMWKLKGAEPTISDDKFYGIIPDGRTFTIDLIEGKKMESDMADGDLRVAIQRPADAIQGKKFDWSFSMQAVDGGVFETSDAYLNEAPESGYQQTYSIAMSASGPNWQNEIQSKIFYIKSRSGKVYGQIKIEVIPKYNDTGIFSIQSVVNPAGSRNLEQDEKHTVNAGSPEAKQAMSSATQ